MEGLTTALVSRMNFNITLVCEEPKGIRTYWGQFNGLKTKNGVLYVRIGLWNRKVRADTVKTVHHCGRVIWRRAQRGEA